jgi:aldose 1-epimerase
MYQYQTTAFGAYTQHELSNNAGHRLAIIPEFSACHTVATIHGVEVLDAYTDYQQMAINRWFKNLPLFPFPNRLNQGLYQWEGATYHLPINDPATGNALHGFSANKVMEVIAVKVEQEEAHVTCRYTYDGQMSGYPFPFELDITFHIHDHNGITIEMSVRNTGFYNMPFGLGWHPYFKLSDNIDHLKLQLPSMQMVGVDENMIPTGKLYDYDKFESSTPIGIEILDNCFLLQQKDGVAEVRLSNEKGTLLYWQDADQFPYIQLFTPPHRESLAIEPMSCNIDAFNNGDGVWNLKPGEAMAGRFGFNWG